VIDSHAHLNDPDFDADLHEVIQRAKAAGVTGIINIGYDLPSSRRAVELAAEYDWMHAVTGVHPHYAQKVTPEILAELEQLARAPQVVAIGETGLDYYYDNSPREIQQQVFHRHLELAERLGLPVVVHSRDATQDTLAIIREHPGNRYLMHCYSQSVESARIYLDLGCYISFAGPVTFKNAHKLRQVAAAVPLDRLLIETDCPYLAPVPHRGKRNEPAWVKHVAEKLSELHSIPVEELIAVTTANTQAFFGIKPKVG
jgi:TatD DNase family protein